MEHLPAREGEARERQLHRGGSNSRRSSSGNLREDILDLLPTPAVAHLRNHDEPIDGYLDRRQDFIDGKTKGMPGASLGVAVRMQQEGIELLRTPSVTDSTGGAISEKQARERGRMVKTADQVAQLAFENGLKVSPAIELALLRTPLVDDSKNTGHSNKRINSLAHETYQIGNKLTLLPTVTTQDGKNTGGASQFDRNTKPLNTQVLVDIEWGKFQPAIERWERVLGRPAPAPTKPDGKDGAHRLSSAFTEWMMGLPENWVVGHGLSRNDELKMCGNGVVPQEAELALRILVEGMPLPGKSATPNLPTPMASDFYSDNFTSTQTKPGSMHSMTLPRIVNVLFANDEDGNDG